MRTSSVLPILFAAITLCALSAGCTTHARYQYTYEKRFKTFPTPAQPSATATAATPAAAPASP